MTERCAIITGATRGIGNGIFKELCAHGVKVATVYHQDETAAEQFRTYAKEHDVPCIIERIDVHDFAGLVAFVQRVIEQFGRLDYLVNNVGIDICKPVREMSLEEWREAQDIILNAPFVLSQQVLPIMRKQHFGRIINIGASSRDYLKGAPGLAAFGVHKGALNIFTKTLAQEEIAQGITVNMVAPGSTRQAGTLPEDERIPIQQIPIGRRIEISEVVAAVRYFLSDAAASVTGQCIGVNGGMST
jgi:NAD(P)-dependent dehydrogenase (short-subunit alcohol dehydrogenase family)